ncbi:hypothetical protein LXL04_020632 [Taraxacum kok-saghyz]
MDYHDLIRFSVKLLTDFPQVFTECQESYQAIVVDEFQDTSTMQYDFFKVLASHKHITIVGNEDQSIFSFNGADVSGFKSFHQDFQPHKEITVKECCNEDAECSFVIDEILQLTSSSVKGTFGRLLFFTGDKSIGQPTLFKQISFYANLFISFGFDTNLYRRLLFFTVSLIIENFYSETFPKRQEMCTAKLSPAAAPTLTNTLAAQKGINATTLSACRTLVEHW